TPQYSLDTRIALLDTPGYTKADDATDTRMVVSDKLMAQSQLRVTDYLIWLIDMDNGLLTQNDIDFIDSLDIKTPILIVFNKADLRSASIRKEILAKATEDVKFMATPVYGIAAYSSKDHVEYTGHIIQGFLKEVANSKLHNNDILQQFQELSDEMFHALREIEKTSEKTVQQLLQEIVKGKNPEALGTMAKLWSLQISESQRAAVFLEELKSSIKESKRLLEKSVESK
ncbi:MAG: GTPase domain-containing protein, partial [Kiritimatiellae bacterium]|nr:GTPase domain-containing protein [Kiritimatiellia bacterium]